MLNVMRDAHDKMSNQARFIKEFMDGDLEISRRAEKDIIADLTKGGYLKIFGKKEKAAAENDDDDDDDDAEPSTGGYDYLLNMNIRSLTMSVSLRATATLIHFVLTCKISLGRERFKKLTAKVKAKAKEISLLENTPPAQIWANDLDALEAALVCFLVFARKRTRSLFDFDT